MVLAFNKSLPNRDITLYGDSIYQNKPLSPVSFLNFQNRLCQKSSQSLRNLKECPCNIRKSQKISVINVKSFLAWKDVMWSSVQGPVFRILWGLPALVRIPLLTTPVSTRRFSGRSFQKLIFTWCNFVARMRKGTPMLPKIEFERGWINLAI